MYIFFQVYGELESIVDKLATDSQRGSYSVKKTNGASLPRKIPVENSSLIINNISSTNSKCLQQFNGRILHVCLLFCFVQCIFSSSVTIMALLEGDNKLRKVINIKTGSQIKLKYIYLFEIYVFKYSLSFIYCLPWLLLKFVRSFRARINY